jgi:Pyruvate/2-oxoacid:ferredoxin oxidoreductase gamma subunit
VIGLPLAEAAKQVHRLAIGAVGVGAVLAGEGFYTMDAFVTAARRLQKAKVAETNIAGLEVGAKLVQ